MRIEDLTRKANLPTLADDLGLLPGGAQRRFCPVCQPHGGKTPDLALREYADKGQWHCFKCDEHGDALDLVKLARGCETPEAMRFLEAFIGGVATTARPSPVARSSKALTANERESVSRVLDDFLARCASMANTPTECYWQGRGVWPHVLEAVGVRHCGARRYGAIHDAMSVTHGGDAMTLAGLAPVSARTGKSYPLAWTYAKANVDFCALPYVEDGRAVALKLRPLVGKAKAEDLGIPRFLATAREVGIYNADALKRGETVFVCEGESDTLTVLACGFEAVGIPGAMTFRLDWARRFDGVNVLLCFDGDAAGDKGARHVAAHFRAAGLRVPQRIALPQGRDVTDCVSDLAAEWLSPSADVMARAVSRTCWRRRGESIPAEQIERDAGLTLQGDERRAVWAEVAEFFSANASLRFEDGAVTWKRPEQTPESTEAQVA